MIRVQENTLQEIEEKFNSIRTDLIKLEYLESVLKKGDISIEIKRFAYSNIAELYESRLMFDKAGHAMSMLAGYQTTYREKIDSDINAAEYFARGMKIMLAEDMFLRAMRESNVEQKKKVEMARKNIFMAVAKELESKRKMNYAAKFYEHLLTLKLDELDKELVKGKLVEYYKRIGKFNDAKIVENR